MRSGAQRCASEEIAVLLSMEYASLSSESKVCTSRLVFGCEPLGGSDWGSVDIREIQKSAAAAFDSGINFFDTASVYGLGESERNLRYALGSRMKDVVISTKVGMGWHSRPTPERALLYRDSKPGSICRMVEESLTRLGIERLPVVLIHYRDPDTPLEETMGAMRRLREQGKVGEVGVSNFRPEDILQAHRLMPLAVVQVEYSLLRREIEARLIPICRWLGIGVMAWGPLAQGLLTDKYSLDHQFPPNDRRRVHPNFEPPSRRRGCVLNAKLRFIAERRSVRPAQSCNALGSGSARNRCRHRWNQESRSVV
jgi:aryl-alcohol dehydrogenase-like predicted oxidoreductase